MRVVVIGAGISGLFTASELSERGADVTLVEASNVAGGVARTRLREGFILEPAAGTLLLPHPHLSPLVERSGVEVTPTVAGDRYLFDGRRLHRIALTPGMLASPLLGSLAKLRLLAEPLVRAETEDEQTVEAFLVERLGRGAGELAAWVAATGVFAGDPARLSARAAFPVLTQLVAEHGSLARGVIGRKRAAAGREPPRPHVPIGGMSRLVDGLVGSLGDRVRLGFGVRQVRRQGPVWRVVGPDELDCERVVVATSPQAAAPLLGGKIGSLLLRGVAAPVAVVWVGARDGGSSMPSGFGAIATPRGGTTGLGYLFESSYAPGRAPRKGWLAKVIIGGAARPEVLEMDDQALAAETIEELSVMLGGPLVPQFAEVIRHSPGIPQYGVGHGDWLAELERALRMSPGIHLTGWGYRGVGIAQLATDAVVTAQSVTAY